jgi:hypothetical protein
MMVLMRVVLATCGALLVVGGVWTAAFTLVGSTDRPGVIGPAVVVGSTSSPATSGAGPTPSASPSRSTEEDHVETVTPSPAVEVTDDHGGRGSGKGKDH